MVCRWCGAKAHLNRTLRISFCFVHGLASPLDDATLPVLRSERAANSDYRPTVLGGGSWAMPMG